jgi:hypothetical protein
MSLPSWSVLRQHVMWTNMNESSGSRGLARERCATRHSAPAQTDGEGICGGRAYLIHDEAGYDSKCRRWRGLPWSCTQAGRDSGTQQVLLEEEK